MYRESTVHCMSNNSILVSLRCEFLLRGFDRDLRLSDNNAELTFAFGANKQLTINLLHA